MNKLTTILVVLTSILFSCSQNGVDKAEYNPVDTTNMIHLSGEVIAPMLTRGCSDMLDFGDYIVMSANIEKRLLHLISKGGEIVKSVGHLGRGNNEFMAVANIQRVGDRDFMAYDAINKILFYYNLDAILKGESTPYKKVDVNSSEIVNNIYQLSEDNYLGQSGYVESKPIKRFSVFSSEGELKSRYDIYPGGEDSLSIAKAYSLQPLITSFSPSTKKMVIANRPIGAVMEIFENKNSAVQPYKTKYLIKPEVDVERTNIVANPEEIIAGFTDIYATEDGIYAAYIGAKADRYPATKLVKFSTKGEVEKVFATDYLNSQILFDEEDDLFYAFTMLPTGEVVLMKYDVSSYM